MRSALGLTVPARSANIEPRSKYEIYPGMYLLFAAFCFSAIFTHHAQAHRNVVLHIGVRRSQYRL